MNGVNEVTQLRALCGAAHATVTLPDGWHVMTEGERDALAMPADLSAFGGDGFVPTILVRVVDEAPYALPEEAGRVLTDTGGVDAGDGVVRRIAVVRGLIGPGQPILQVTVSCRRDEFQALVVASATAAQWPLVAAGFDAVAESAVLQVGTQEVAS